MPEKVLDFAGNKPYITSTMAYDEANLDQLIDKKLDKFANRILAHVDKRMDELAIEVKDTRMEMHRIYDIMDGLAKRVDDDKERAALATGQKRHGTWIRQLARHTGAQLAPPA